jgi:hypothetical protein
MIISRANPNICGITGCDKLTMAKLMPNICGNLQYYAPLYTEGNFIWKLLARQPGVSR